MSRSTPCSAAERRLRVAGVTQLKLMRAMASELKLSKTVEAHHEQVLDLGAHVQQFHRRAGVGRARVRAD